MDFAPKPSFQYINPSLTNWPLFSFELPKSKNSLDLNISLIKWENKKSKLPVVFLVELEDIYWTWAVVLVSNIVVAAISFFWL